MGDKEGDASNIEGFLNRGDKWGMSKKDNSR